MNSVKLILIVLLAGFAILITIRLLRPDYKLTRKDYSQMPYNGTSSLFFANNTGDTFEFDLAWSKQLASYYNPEGAILSGWVEGRQLLYKSNDTGKPQEILFHLTFSQRRKLALEIDVYNVAERYFSQYFEFETLPQKKDTTVEINGVTYPNAKVLPNNFSAYSDYEKKTKSFFSRLYWTAKEGVILLETDDGYRLSLLSRF